MARRRGRSPMGFLACQEPLLLLLCANFFPGKEGDGEGWGGGAIVAGGALTPPLPQRRLLFSSLVFFPIRVGPRSHDPRGNIPPWGGELWERGGGLVHRVPRDGRFFLFLIKVKHVQTWHVVGLHVGTRAKEPWASALCERKTIKKTC